MFSCGQEGHFKRNCPSANVGRSDPVPTSEPVRENRSVTAVGPNARRVYLEVLIDGEPVDCLLDTGSEVTLIPSRLVTELPKRAIRSLIRAANETDIEVLGEVELPVRIENRDVLVRGIASDHVAEMLLVIDWLEGQGAVWDLRRDEIHMQGSVFPLKARTNDGWCQRVIVQEPMMVPARSESHVLSSTVYRDLKSVWPTWVSKPGSPRDELRVARAIVPDRCKDVTLLIMNVANYPV